MKFAIRLLLMALLASNLVGIGAEVTDDDDFAEFDFEDEEESDVINNLDKDEVNFKPKEAPPVAAAALEEEDDDDEEFINTDLEDDEGVVEVDFDDNGDEEAIVEDENEFSHFEDDEEFEGYRSEDGDDEFETAGSRKSKKKEQQQSSQQPPKTINITKIPAHLRTNWENYYLEILMIVGIVVYFVNFFTGKTKNHKIANAWFQSHKALLESNFSLVGDDGSKDIDDIDSQLQKESESVFTLWCSGRTCCEGMLVEIKLLKRQDLVSVMSAMMKPTHDQVHIKVHMDDMDTFVFALAQRKTAIKMAKELNDINTFCPERRNAEKFGVPANYVIMSEVAETAPAMLDSKMIAILNKFPDAVESIHFSDQYTGPKPTDDQALTSLPEGRKVLIFVFNILLMTKVNGEKKVIPIEEATESMKPLMLLVFYFMDKIKRFRLSREAKNKADKNRSKVAEAFWKSIHAAKAEKAQEERERKRRELKERIREIEDPDKQRKLEDRENRRDRKKNAPKMKQLKVKAM